MHRERKEQREHRRGEQQDDYREEIEHLVAGLPSFLAPRPRVGVPSMTKTDSSAASERT